MPVTYALERANGTLEMTLTEQRLVVKTQGRGLIDKLQTIDIPLATVEKFCVVPTIRAQNIVAATGTSPVYDDAYDAEFVFSYRDGEKLRKKRVFVNREDENWNRLLEELSRDRPTASLLHLEPAEAQKQIGALPASKAFSLVVGIIVGVPLVIGAIVLISKAVSGH